MTDTVKEALESIKEAAIDLLHKIEGNPVVQTVVADAKDVESVSWNWLKTNGLQDLYQIALALVGAAVPGTNWTTILANIEAQAIADGKQLVAGASAVAAAQAQADLIAAGKLLPPVANAQTAEVAAAEAKVAEVVAGAPQ